MAPHSSTLAWKIPWKGEPGRLQSMRSLESDMTEWLHFHFSLSCIWEGNGNPLHYSCLENPRDGGACGLLSMGSHRVGHDWCDLAAAAAGSLIQVESQYLSFCVWLLSLSSLSLEFLHFVTCVRVFFLVEAVFSSFACTDHTWLVCSSMDLGLLPSSGSYESRCREPRCANVWVNCFLSFWVYTKSWDHWTLCSLCLKFFEELPRCTI